MTSSEVDRALNLLLQETRDVRLVDALHLVRRAMQERERENKELQREVKRVKHEAAMSSASMRSELVDLRRTLVSDMRAIQAEGSDENNIDGRSDQQPELLMPLPPPSSPPPPSPVLKPPPPPPPLAALASPPRSNPTSPRLLSALLSRVSELEVAMSATRAAAEQPITAATAAAATEEESAGSEAEGGPSTRSRAALYGRRQSVPAERRERQLRWRLEWEGSDDGLDADAAPSPPPRRERSFSEGSVPEQQLAAATLGSVPVSTASRLIDVSSDSSSSELDSDDGNGEEEEEEEETTRICFPSARGANRTNEDEDEESDSSSVSSSDESLAELLEEFNEAMTAASSGDVGDNNSFSVVSVESDGDDETTNDDDDDDDGSTTSDGSIDIDDDEEFVFASAPSMPPPPLPQASPPPLPPPSHMLTSMLASNERPPPPSERPPPLTRLSPPALPTWARSGSGFGTAAPAPAPTVVAPIPHPQRHASPRKASPPATPATPATRAEQLLSSFEARIAHLPATVRERLLRGVRTASKVADRKLASSSEWRTSPELAAEQPSSASEQRTSPIRPLEPKPNAPPRTSPVRTVDLDAPVAEAASGAGAGVAATPVQTVDRDTCEKLRYARQRARQWAIDRGIAMPEEEEEEEVGDAAAPAVVADDPPGLGSMSFGSSSSRARVHARTAWSTRTAAARANAAVFRSPPERKTVDSPLPPGLNVAQEKQSSSSPPMWNHPPRRVVTPRTSPSGTFRSSAGDDLPPGLGKAVEATYVSSWSTSPKQKSNASDETMRVRMRMYGSPPSSSSQRHHHHQQQQSASRVPPHAQAQPPSLSRSAPSSSERSARPRYGRAPQTFASPPPPASAYAYTRSPPVASAVPLRTAATAATAESTMRADLNAAASEAAAAAALASRLSRDTSRRRSPTAETTRRSSPPLSSAQATARAVHTRLAREKRELLERQRTRVAELKVRTCISLRHTVSSSLQHTRSHTYLFLLLNNRSAWRKSARMRRTSRVFKRMSNGGRNAGHGTSR